MQEPQAMRAPRFAAQGAVPAHPLPLVHGLVQRETSVMDVFMKHHSSHCVTSSIAWLRSYMPYTYTCRGLARVCADRRYLSAGLMGEMNAFLCPVR